MDLIISGCLETGNVSKSGVVVFPSRLETEGVDQCSQYKSQLETRVSRKCKAGDFLSAALNSGPVSLFPLSFSNEEAR